jgi:sterol desaturase/sphingolipid hydroxylase (fatty acid hydroxylase superfamily)
MDFFHQAFDSLRTMPLEAASIWALVENVVIFALALAVGHILVRVYKSKAVAEPPPPITWIEIALAISCVLLNTAVTIVGMTLWRAGIIRIRYEWSLRIVVDVLVLFFAMDFAMYVLHRVAHIRWLYPLLHQTHHRFENPRPLTLFVLNPLETISFGVLWLLVITLYPSTLIGIIIYLSLNIAFGLIGHLGVEPLPVTWLNLPVIKLISTSTFHAEHHDDRHHNFGFYTLIWDRLFGTLSPDYTRDFNAANATPQVGETLS